MPQLYMLVCQGRGESIERHRGVDDREMWIARDTWRDWGSSGIPRHWPNEWVRWGSTKRWQIDFRFKVYPERAGVRPRANEQERD